MENSILSQEEITESYLQLKVEKAQRIASRTIQGVPLAKLGKTLDVGTLKFPFPIIFGCYCVQDTPDNPCPCKNILVWLLEPPIEIFKTGKRNTEGKEIISFVMPKDTELAIDLQMPIRLGDLNRIISLAKSYKGKNANTNSPTSGKAPLPLGWLSLAATVGWGIGSLLDDLLGSGEDGNDNLSDDLSDWAAENFPAPGWLQDIF